MHHRICIHKTSNPLCSQVRARTSVGYGRNSTALDVTLPVEGQLVEVQPVIVVLSVVIAFEFLVATVLVAALIWRTYKAKTEVNW